MGRPPGEPGNSIQHFSHPHPLHMSDFDPREHSSSSCAACKLKLFGSLYSCRVCGFHLHAKCSDLPQKIKHPFDKIHLLSLLASPKYEEGCFRCDACGKHGDGFSYHCGECGIDLHTVCANMPSRVSNQSHLHQLSLTFFVPYNSGSFHCNICRGIGSNSWLYRCKECEFDAHLMCARKKGGQTNQATSSSNLQARSVPINNNTNINGNNNYYRPNQPPVIGTPFSPVTPNLNPMMSNRSPSAARPTVNPTSNILTSLLVPRHIRLAMHLLKTSGATGGGGPSGGADAATGMAGFDPTAAGGFDPSSFPGFDPSSLSGFDPSAFGGFDPSAFGGFDPSAFAGFDPSAFAGFDPSMFAGLDPSMFGLF